MSVSGLSSAGARSKRYGRCLNAANKQRTTITDSLPNERSSQVFGYSLHLPLHRTALTGERGSGQNKRVRRQSLEGAVVKFEGFFREDEIVVQVGCGNAARGNVESRTDRVDHVRGALVSWYRGTMVSWYHGTMAPWYHCVIAP